MHAVKNSPTQAKNFGVPFFKILTIFKGFNGFLCLVPQRKIACHRLVNFDARKFDVRVFINPIFFAKNVVLY